MGEGVGEVGGGRGGRHCMNSYKGSVTRTLTTFAHCLQSRNSFQRILAMTAILATLHAFDIMGLWDGNVLKDSVNSTIDDN